MFDDEISPEEALMYSILLTLQSIEKRVQLQQRQFQEYEKSENLRKERKLLSLWDFLTRREIRLALGENDGSEEATIL